MSDVYYFDLKDGETGNYSALQDEQYLLWDKKFRGQVGDYCIVYYSRAGEILSTEIESINEKAKQDSKGWYVPYKGKKYYFSNPGGRFQDFMVFAIRKRYKTDIDFVMNRQGGAAMLTSSHSIKFKERLPELMGIVDDREVRDLLGFGGESVALPKTSESALLLTKKQIIFYGPPGTGKTFGTKGCAIDMVAAGVVSADGTRYTELREQGRIEFVTFHPSYSYEEFMEGVTIDVDPSGKPTKDLQYKLKQGIFKIMASKSLAGALEHTSTNYESVDVLLEEYRKLEASLRDQGKSVTEWWNERPRYVLIIDEINRADISKVFGELITLLEADKRLGMENELVVRLPYSHERFAVPPNLYIIGTMNTADKSIALIDVALRRRFAFIEKAPDFAILRSGHLDANKAALEGEGVHDGLDISIQALEMINSKICRDRSVGRDKQIGHSFLFKVNMQSDLIMVWQNEILPLLEEYYYGDYDKINELLFDEETSRWITPEQGIVGFSDYDDLIKFVKKIAGRE